jgi:hypothetical protein
LVHEENIGDRVVSRDGFDGRWIFNSPPHLMEKGFVNDFVDEGTFA